MTVKVAPGFTRTPSIITGSIKTSCRVFYTDGTSKYITSSIPDFEGRTLDSATEYFMKSMWKYVGMGEVLKIKLISVGGRKINITV